MEKLKLEIKESGRSIKWVAKKIGVPYMSLIMYLNGTRNPKKDIESMVRKVL